MKRFLPGAYPTYLSEVVGKRSFALSSGWSLSVQSGLLPTYMGEEGSIIENCSCECPDPTPIPHTHFFIPLHWAFVCSASSSWHWCSLSPGAHPGNRSSTLGNGELGGVGAHSMLPGPRFPPDCGRQGCCHGGGCTQPQWKHCLEWAGGMGGHVNVGNRLNTWPVWKQATRL